jgi:hypothetical protein
MSCERLFSLGCRQLFTTNHFTNQSEGKIGDWTSGTSVGKHAEPIRAVFHITIPARRWAVKGTHGAGVMEPTPRFFDINFGVIENPALPSDRNRGTDRVDPTARPPSN